MFESLLPNISYGVLFLDVILGAIVFLDNRQKLANLMFVGMVLAVAVWVISLIVFGTAPQDSALLALRAAFIGATFIAAFFIAFVFHFPESTKIQFWRIVAIFIPALLLAIASITSSLVVQEITPQEGVRVYTTTYGPLYYAFIAYFVGTIAFAFYWLGKKYKTQSPLGKLQLRYLFIGCFVAVSVGATTNLLIPALTGNSEYSRLGQLSVLIFLILSAYGILKHHLFSVKVIATELFVFLLWALSLWETIISESPEELFFNGAIFGLTVLVGIFLIRSVFQEVYAREEIQLLADKLERANARLRELDQLKSEFVSIASHQLRSPLTAIKGYASLLLEGSFGKLSGSISEAVERIFESAKAMALSVEDFLNVSRIEQGRMKYDCTNTDLGTLTENVVKDLVPVAHNKKLFLKLQKPKEALLAYVDGGKIKQVLSNLIDNSIKYTEQGGIMVRLQRKGRSIAISITDTGVGISKDAIPKLFDKFVRAKNANKVNVTGTGLGLYVAKQFIEAHQGSISVASPGEGQGSTFTITLPEVTQKML